MRSKNDIKKYNGYSRNIISAYERNAFCLDVLALGHFFARAYKITGKNEYKEPIAKSFFAIRLSRIKKAPKIIRERKYPQKPFSQRLKNERSIKRAKLYQERPEISFFNLLLMDMLYIHKFNLQKSILKKEYQQILLLLRTINFEKLYLDKKVIMADSSYSINSIFILKYFNIIDLTEKLECLIKKAYLTKTLCPRKNMSEADFCSLIYNLTHIIISDTGFYEYRTGDHRWITNFFSDNIKEIRKKVTEDILAEIGLCFRLRNEITHPILKMIQRNFSDNWPWKKLNDPSFLREKEHTNSILMLLFSNNENFLPGPNLNKKNF